MDDPPQALGANPNALKMANVVKFYERLPQGPAPEAQGRGILGRYAAKHFNGKNASGKRMSSSSREADWRG